MLRLLPLLALLCGCAAAMSPDSSSSGLPPGAPAWCPDAQNAQAIANGAAAVPFPSVLGSSFDHTSFFHPCLNPDGSQSMRSGAPCYVCGNLYDQTPILISDGSTYSACTEDTLRSPSPPANLLVICVKPLDPNNLSSCDPPSQLCY